MHDIGGQMIDLFQQNIELLQQKKIRNRVDIQLHIFVIQMNKH